MESLVPSTISSLGLSNIDLVSLTHIYTHASIKPRSVQNRFTRDTIDKPDPTMLPVPYPVVAFDRDVRGYCGQMGIAYAPWGLLWGSLEVLDGGEGVLTRLGRELGVSREIACFACMRALSGCEVTLLCGTSNEGRMRETLEGLEKAKRFAGGSDGEKEVWGRSVERFGFVTDGDR